MGKERNRLTPDQAIAMLPERDRIHTFRNPAGILVGCDWDRADIIEAIMADGANPELAGELATSMGHGLVLWIDEDPLFVETRKVEEVASR